MWFWWTILAAGFSAAVTILIKHSLKNTSASVVSLAMFSLNTPLILWLAFNQGFNIQVKPWFFWGALCSSIIFSLAIIFRLSATKKLDLSKLTPLTCFNPFFAYILALIFLRERIQLTGLTGLGLITIGAYILNMEPGKNNLFKPFKLLFTEKSSQLFMVSIGLTSVANVLDKISIINTAPLNPALTLLIENIMISALIFGFLQLKKPRWQVEFKTNFWLLLLISIIYALNCFLVMKSFTIGPVALISGVKQLQIFFILILSWLFFKDRPSRQTWLATGLMATGVVLIKLV
ncbi:MAG: EamA family transporter [Candidatus Beckwithbacteria bacterium]